MELYDIYDAEDAEREDCFGEYAKAGGRGGGGEDRGRVQVQEGAADLLLDLKHLSD